MKVLKDNKADLDELWADWPLLPPDTALAVDPNIHTYHSLTFRDNVCFVFKVSYNINSFKI